jgi:nucleoside-diphosphate-sugar epimerase
MASERILMFNGGDRQVLDYIHVEDLCDFIVHCLHKETGTFNVCCGDPIDTGKLAKIIGKDVTVEDVEPGEYSKINPVLKRTLHEVKGVSLSNEKVRQTGWKPKHSISNILDDYF